MNTSWLEVDPDEEFEALATRVAGLGPPPPPRHPADFDSWPLAEAVLYLANRILSDDHLRAAAKRVFTESWLVRRTSETLAAALELG